MLKLFQWSQLNFRREQALETIKLELNKIQQITLDITFWVNPYRKNWDLIKSIIVYWEKTEKHQENEIMWKEEI
jgi:hypothetical protein